MTTAAALASVRERVPFARLSVDAAPEHAVAFADLDAPGGVLDAILGESPAARSTNDARVAASTFLQSYATVTLAAAAALWIATDTALPCPPTSTRVNVVGGMCFDAWTSATPTGDGIADVVESAFDEHLDRLADAVATRVPVGHAVLWGNAATAVLSAAVRLESAAKPDERARITARSDLVLAALPHGAGALVQRDATRAHGIARANCCLMNVEEGAGACSACPVLA